MTPEFWNLIHPQLEELIAESLVGYTPDELTDMINWQNDWHKQRPFSDMRVWYTKETDYSITEWIVQAEAHTGKSGKVDSAFRERLKLIIEYQWAVRQKELAEEYEHELKVAI